MASRPVKKRKVTDEDITFKQEWTLEYFFIEEKGKRICQSVNVMKSVMYPDTTTQCTKMNLENFMVRPGNRDSTN